MIPQEEAETDLRSAYCAAAITFILTANQSNNEKQHLNVGFDINKLVNYIESCRSFQGGFGDPYNLESHTGLTYCATAALFLLKKDIIEKDKLVEFLMMR